MAYNRVNLLKTIIDIQKIVQHWRNKDGDITYTWIFKNIIEPRYHITHRTFTTYLGVPAEKQLKLIEAQAETHGHASIPDINKKN